MSSSTRYQFDITTLRTDFAPDSEQAAHIKNTISSENQVLSDLLRKVDDLEKQLYFLQAQRQVVHSSVSIHLALVAPIRKLSPEVLMEIFEHCTDEQPSFSARKCPLLLTHVCHKWRRIAHGSPRLWTQISIGTLYPRETIDLDFSPNTFPRSNISDPIKLWLKNSGSLPLEISLHPDKGLKSKQLSGELLEQFPRVKKASFSGRIETLDSIIPLNKSLQLPHLQSLSVKCSSQSQPVQASRVARWDTPQLHSLILEHASFFIEMIKPTSRLHQLIIRGEKEEIPLLQWLSFVKDCVALEVLVIPLNCIAEDDEQIFPEDGLELPFLRQLFLTLRASTSGGLALPLNFRAPKLHELQISGFGYHEETEPVTQTLDNIIVGCRSTIKEMTFSGTAFPEETGRRWLGLLTAVESLSITSESLAILIPSNATDDAHKFWTCPKLVEIWILDYQEGCRLKELVERRSLARGSSPQLGAHYLKHVHLTLLRWKYYPGSTWQELRDVEEIGNSRDFTVYGLDDD